MTSSESDRIVETKLKTENPQNAKEALLDMLVTSQSTASASLKDALYQRIEIVLNGLTVNAVKSTSVDAFIMNLEGGVKR